MAENKEDKKEHKCWYYKGRIRDVTVRNKKDIHCRRCGAKLTDSEVSPSILTRIKKELRKGKSKESKNGRRN